MCLKQSPRYACNSWKKITWYVISAVRFQMMQVLYEIKFGESEHQVPWNVSSQVRLIMLWQKLASLQVWIKQTVIAQIKVIIYHQVKAQPPFELHLADWPWSPLELISEFSHTPLTILAQYRMMAGFIKTMQAGEMQNYKNISIFCKVKPKSGEKKCNISKNHLSTVYLKSSEKINCAISEIQWRTKIIKMWSNRTSFQVGWSRLTSDGDTIPAP